MGLPILPIARRSLPVDTVRLARFLIGKLLVRDVRGGRMSGKIVETEAYPVGDSTGYAYRGRTLRNAPLFLERGHAYVRLVYGAAYSLNLGAERNGVGAAVLIRAIEPLEGIALMRRRRAVAKGIDLARGPGRLATALGLDPSYDGHDLFAGKSLWIGRLIGSRSEVGVTTRIGLSREAHRRLRFYEIGSPFVSGPRGAISGQHRRHKSRLPAGRRK